MVAHRIADRRILRLIRGWLRAGVMEGQRWSETVQGTPQGSGISPLLANVFMHYVLDLWVHQWRKRYARGRVIIVRYCDDFVLGFEHEADARRMLADLKERLAKFKLALHEEKTRLIEFGKRASELRLRRGARRCETFRFLGFTHYCARSPNGHLVVKRRTDRMRLTRKLKELRVFRRGGGCIHRWCCNTNGCASVLRGHYAYFGLPSNSDRLGAFYQEHAVSGIGRSIAAASGGSCGSAFRLLERFPLPVPRITHPRTGGPLLTRANLRRSRVRESRSLGSVRAKAEWLSYSTIVVG